VINQTDMPVAQPECGTDKVGVMMSGVQQSISASSVINQIEIPVVQPEGNLCGEDNKVRVMMSTAQQCNSSSGTTQPNFSGTFSNCSINLCFSIVCNFMFLVFILILCSVRAFLLLLFTEGKKWYLQ